eukprot:3938796-Rhodomonas_salina.1
MGSTWSRAPLSPYASPPYCPMLFTLPPYTSLLLPYAILSIALCSCSIALRFPSIALRHCPIGASRSFFRVVQHPLLASPESVQESRAVLVLPPLSPYPLFCTALRVSRYCIPCPTRTLLLHFSALPSPNYITQPYLTRIPAKLSRMVVSRGALGAGAGAAVCGARGGGAACSRRAAPLAGPPPRGP